MAVLSNKAMKFGVLGAAVAMAATLATTSYAENSKAAQQAEQQHRIQQAAQEAMNPYSDSVLERMAVKLQMDDDTKEEASDLFAEAREERKELINEMRELRAPVQMLSPRDDDYVDQVADLAEKRSDLMVKMDVQQAEIRHQFYALLSDEQIQKLESANQKGS